MANKLNRKGKEPMGERMKRLVKAVRIGFKNNVIWIRTVLLALSMFLILGGVAYGFNHSNKVERERAMTISDIDQDISFSLTSTSLSLQPQRINGDTVVIPFRFNNMKNMSTDADKYHVFLKYADGMPINPNVVANIAIFGATNDGALILDGPLEQKPLQVAIRDDSDLGTGRASQGPFTFDGAEIPVEFNAASFTINPRAENLTVDEKIAPDMTVEALYMSAVGDRLVRQLETDLEAYEESKAESESLVKEYERRLVQSNEALGLSPTDRERLDSDTSSGRYNSADITLDEETLNEIGDANLAAADMRTIRNAVLRELETEEANVTKMEENIEAVELRKSELDEFINNINGITSIGTSYELMSNE